MESVTKCSKLKEWNGKPIYQIEMSNGAIGESFQDIPVGTPDDQLTFTKNQNSAYADRIKWNKPNAGGGGFAGRGNRSGNESFALSYAKDLAIAYVAKDKNIEPEKIVEWAEVFYNWMETKKK
jgi:hypothetical protein